MTWTKFFQLVEFLLSFLKQAHDVGLLDETQGFHPGHPKTQAILDHVVSLGSNAQPKG